MSATTKAFNVIAKGVSSLVQSTIKTMADHGHDHILGATYVSIGAMVGAAQVVASLVCHKNDAAPATGITNDSLLFSALLMTRSIDATRDKTDGRAVCVDTVFSPESFALAIEDFRKLTGRSVEGVIDPVYIDCVADYKAQGNGADSLLQTICANHRPA